MTVRSGIKLICLDIDGTLCIDGRAYPGAVAAVQELSRRFELAFVTNTTSKSVESITGELTSLGFMASAAQVYNPSRVIKDHLISSGHASGLLMIEPDARADYNWFREVSPDDPDCRAVLIGTEGYDLTFADLGRPLEALLSGASLYALQKNRFYLKEGRFILDLGPITAALEYASGKTARIFGKPSKELFGRVAGDFGVSFREMAMVGDDIEFDVFGAMRLGLTGILVKTGKFDPGFASKFQGKPNLEAASIAEIPLLL